MKKDTVIHMCLLVVCIAVAGCRTQETDLSSTPEFMNQVGRRWVLLDDCNVFQFKAQRDDQVYLGEAGANGPNYRACNILGTIPKGTEVSVVAVRRRQTFEHDHYIFDLKPMSAQSTNWPVLNGLWLVERKFPPDGLDTNLAKRVKR